MSSRTLLIREKKKVIEEINPQAGQSIFFTSIEYGQPYHIFNRAGFFFDQKILKSCWFQA